jgi:hypothetical protein
VSRLGSVFGAELDIMPCRTVAMNLAKYQNVVHSMCVLYEEIKEHCKV